MDAANADQFFEYDNLDRLFKFSAFEARCHRGLRSLPTNGMGGPSAEELAVSSSTVSYHYDDARRLVKIIDSRGNSINYTLDGAGNRTAEIVNDPHGVLALQLTRKFDALGRVQSQTGVAQ